MPKVEFIEPDLARWTFESADPATHEAEFKYWRGWFGFEESDWPHRIDGQVWLVRKGGQGQAS